MNTNTYLKAAPVNAGLSTKSNETLAEQMYFLRLPKTAQNTGAGAGSVARLWILQILDAKVTAAFSQRSVDHRRRSRMANFVGGLSNRVPSGNIPESFKQKRMGEAGLELVPVFSKAGQDCRLALQIPVQLNSCLKTGNQSPTK